MDTEGGEHSRKDAKVRKQRWYHRLVFALGYSWWSFWYMLRELKK